MNVIQKGCSYRRAMSYSQASPLYDPVLARVQRIMFRKMTLTDIALDVIVCLALTTVVVVQRLATSALLFDQLNDSWTTWAWWKVYLPSTLNAMLLPWVYCTVMYHLFPLLGAFIVIAAIIAFIDLIFLFWLTVDWFNCKNVLWCANLSYWTTDPVTEAKEGV